MKEIKRPKVIEVVEMAPLLHEENNYGRLAFRLNTEDYVFPRCAEETGHSLCLACAYYIKRNKERIYDESFEFVSRVFGLYKFCYDAELMTKRTRFLHYKRLKGLDIWGHKNGSVFKGFEFTRYSEARRKNR